jgi:hypothetical protein
LEGFFMHKVPLWPQPETAALAPIAALHTKATQAARRAAVHKMGQMD